MDTNRPLIQAMEPKRTIEEVLDVETGEIIKTIDFFRKPESEIMADRRRLAEAISGFSPPKYKCIYCNQLLKLSGKSTQRGHVSFFAHYYDSEDCEIKTNGDLSKEEIEAKKYANVSESTRHIELKNFIASHLKSIPDISNVELEKPITSNNPYLHWKRPDVYAEFQNKKVVFELQLSTTFLSVVIERDIFYRANNIFIIWIFNFSENREYVNLGNLMCKDIYYSNKRNAFILDNHAQLLSQTTGELHLLCVWFEPVVENGDFQLNQGIKKEQYIRFSDLRFDERTFKPYFIDADSLFAKYQPNQVQTKLDLENAFRVRLEKLAKKQVQAQLLLEDKQERFKAKKIQLANSETELRPFKNGKKWGFEADGIIIIEANYVEVSEFSKCGFSKVKLQKKIGFVDKTGEVIFGCIFDEAFTIFDSICICREKQDWYEVNLTTSQKKNINCKAVTFFQNSIHLLELSFHESLINLLRISAVVTMNNKRIRKCIHLKVVEYAKEELGTVKEEWLFLTDYNGSEHRIKVDNYAWNRHFDSGEYFIGYTDINGESIIPAIYQSLSAFKKGIAIARKNGKYGIINKKNEVVLPFRFDEIELFDNGSANVRIGQMHGFLDNHGNGLVPFLQTTKYLGRYGETLEKQLIGFEDMKGKLIVEPKYHMVDKFCNGLAKVYAHQKYIGGGRDFPEFKYKVGIIDWFGNEIIPCMYSELGRVLNGKVIAKLNGKVIEIPLSDFE